MTNMSFYIKSNKTNFKEIKMIQFNENHEMCEMQNTRNTRRSEKRCAKNRKTVSSLILAGCFCLSFLMACSTEELKSSAQDLLGNVDSQEDRDRDGDGVVNAVDNCPDVANTDGQNQDMDMDGIGDACDTVNNLDSDGDTILDMMDNCLNTPNTDQSDSDNDGIGNVCDFNDADEDGITDADDNCPNHYNPSQDVTLGLSLMGRDGCTVTTEGNPPVPASGDACLNADADSALDMADNCKCQGDADQRDPDGDGDGIPCDPDDDNDGILDAADNCPLHANVDQRNTDGASDGGDACDPDDDNDTIPDDMDNCALVQNSDQRNYDRDMLGDACDPVNNTRFETIDAFERALREGSTFTAPTPQPPTRTEEEATNEVVTEMVTDPMTGNMVTQTYNCRVDQYAASAGYNELFLLNPTSSVIYPGAVLDGASIQDGRYQLISSGRRRPMNVSVSIVGGSRTSAAIQNPNSLAEVRTELNRIVSQATAPPPQNSQLTTMEVYNGTHFGLAFGIDVGARIGPSVQVSLGTDFSVNRATSQRKYMSRFSHRYYTVDVDIPRRPADFYEEFPTIGNAVPVYVSSVTYGRLAFFEMDSRNSLTDVSAALTAGLNVQGRVSVEGMLSARFQQIMTEANIRATAIGGTQTRQTISDIDSFSNFLNLGGQRYQDGVPISYTLRFLSDQSVARSNLSSTYSVRQCSLQPPSDRDQIYRLQIVGMRAHSHVGNVDVSGRLNVGTTHWPRGYDLTQCRISSESATTPAFDIARGQGIDVRYDRFTDLRNRNLIFEVPVRAEALNPRNVQRVGWSGTLPASRPNFSFCASSLHLDGLGAFEALLPDQHHGIAIGQLELHRAQNPWTFKFRKGQVYDRGLWIWGLEVQVAFISKRDAE